MAERPLSRWLVLLLLVLLMAVSAAEPGKAAEGFRLIGLGGGELSRAELESGTDSEGFPTERDELLASVRAYREDRYGSEAWKNRSLFSKATTLFRIRVIAGIKLDTRCVVVTEDGRYNILSVVP